MKANPWIVYLGIDHVNHLKIKSFRVLKNKLFMMGGLDAINW